ncbi:MAG: T9SS type A sorting domain-containing protein [Flavobacteriales bacterium]
MKPNLLAPALVALLSFSSLYSFAQCADGEVEVQLIIHTDAWAYEMYWQLREAGTPCGPDFIAQGANLNVGCAGTAAGNSPNGYANNSTYTEGPFCVTEGQSYSLIYVDSYGDGGMVVELLQDGALTNIYNGTGDGNTWTFVAGESNVPQHDMPCNALDVTPDGEALLFSNAGALASIGEPRPAAGNCAMYGLWCEGGLTNSVWAKFVAEANVAYQFNTCVEGNAFDTQMAIYRVTDCGDWDTFELISSNDDMFGGCSIQVFSSLCYASCLEEGATYYIQIDGYNGASGNIALEVTTYTGPVTLNAQVSGVNCPLNKGEQGNGVIRPYIVGTGSDFTSEWTGPNGFESTSNFITELNGGQYTLTATTSCGTVFTGNYTITVPQPFNISAQFIQPDCPLSDNGAITLTVSGATPGYEFIWEGPDGFASSNEDLTGLVPGVYTISIEDDNGCDAEGSYTLNALDNLTFDLGPDATLCRNFNDVLVLSGPANLNYSWQDGSQNQFFVINAGSMELGEYTYILTANTDDGCVAADAIVITIEDCVGIREHADLRPVIYPNPTSDELNFRFTLSAAHRIELIDAAGRMAFTTTTAAGNTMHSIAPDLATGIYQCRITAGETVWMERVVVR